MAQGLFAMAAGKSYLPSEGPDQQVCFAPSKSDGIIEICSNEVVTTLNAAISGGMSRKHKKPTSNDIRFVLAVL